MPGTELFCSSCATLSSAISFAQTHWVPCSLSSCSRDHPIVNEVLYQLSHLQKAGKSVVFCWVRGHTVLPGSERAALNRNLTSDRALGSDFRTFLYRAVLSPWQDEWSNTQDNKLHTVKPSLQTWHFSFSVVRKEEVMLTWLPIGHMRVAHGSFVWLASTILC
jgi:hypothetical protein